MDFADLGGWFNELPHHERDHIESLGTRAAAESVGARLVPESHGIGIEAQLRAATSAFLGQSDPFCLIRVSDSELALLGGGYLPPGTPQNLEWYRFRGGLGPRALELRPTFLQAVAGAELVGLQQNWKPITESSAVLLSLLRFPLPMPNGVEVHLPYQLLVDGVLFEWLAGKRVVLIGTFAPRLAQVWGWASFRKAYSTWGPVNDVEIVGAVSTTSRTEGGSAQDYETVLSQLERITFDVALLSCGVAAKPLAWQIRKAGRTALDVGFVFNALLGDQERAKRPVLRDADWPL